MEFRVYIEDVSIIGNVFGHSVLYQIGTTYIINPHKPPNK